MVKKIIVVFIIFSIVLTGCGKEQASVPCEYENIKKCDIGDIISANNKQYHITQLMKNHSVRIKNQKVSASGYEIKLDQFFYNKNTGVVVYKFMISDSKGSLLTDVQYKKLTTFHENGELDLMNERSGRPFIDVLQRDKNKQVVWYKGILLSAISPQDEVSDITQKESLGSVVIYLKNDKAGEISLPEYDYKEEIIQFNVSSSKQIISAKMTESGLNIIWNIGDILTKFHDMIKELPEGENPEGYNYSIYKKIYINMKDGTRYNMLDFYCDEEVIEENSIASFSVIWKYGISMEQVDSLEVDGVRFYGDKK